jgi:outer membrane protein OmpA-like peptidoglycan-associated protein
MKTSTSRTFMRIALIAVAALIATTGLKAQSAIGTVITLSGYVLDQSTLLPVQANFSVYDMSNKKVGRARKATVADGYLVTGLKPGQTYKFRIEDPRYFKQEYSVVVPQTGKYAEMSKDFVVRKMMAGKRLAINPPPFDRSKTTVKGGTEEDLKGIADMLIMNPGVKIELIAFPDEEVSASKASSISRERGNALKQFLESAGVNGSRITVKVADSVDQLNPPPLRKGAKGKRYIGSVYMLITSV